MSMPDIDWNTPTGEDFQERLEALVAMNVLDILALDPRDEMLGDLLYYHVMDDIITLDRQINNVMELGGVLSQILIRDLTDIGFAQRNSNGSIEITANGLAFAEARLEGPDMNGICRVREHAPAYGPLSAAASTAIKYLILNDDQITKSLISDVYHPSLGRATF